MTEEKVERRRWIKTVGGTIIGLAVGAVAGYLGGTAAVPAKEVTVTVPGPTVTKEVSVPGPTVTLPAAKPQYHFACYMRSLKGAHPTLIAAGCDQAAKYLGAASYTAFACEWSSEKQLSQVESWIMAYGGENCILYVDPNESGVARPIVEVCEKNKAHIVVEWAKPDDLHPKDYTYFVAFKVPDGVQAGHEAARALFREMAEQGTGDKIVVMRGMPGCAVEFERWIGLQEACKEEGIKMLGPKDGYICEWRREVAASSTEDAIGAFGEEIGGIWAANDDMALGAHETWKRHREMDRYPIAAVDAVPEMVEKIMLAEGGVAASMSSDVLWQGGVDLLYGFLAKVYGWYPPVREMAYNSLLVDKRNAKEFYDANYAGLEKLVFPPTNWFHDLFKYPYIEFKPVAERYPQYF